MKKNVARLVFCLVLLVLALAQVPAAHADLTCSDCFNLCMLSNCGFVSDPSCEAAYWSECNSYCQPPNC